MQESEVYECSVQNIPFLLYMHALFLVTISLAYEYSHHGFVRQVLAVCWVELNKVIQIYL